MPSPAIVSQETYAALVEAAHPSSAEVLRVKDALRARLAVGAANTDELENGVAEVMGLPPIAPREDPYDVHPEVPIESRIDRDAVPIKRVRIRYAARLALAELAAAYFSWLILSIPLNQAMFFPGGARPRRRDLDRYADEGVRIFLAAYGA